MAVVSWLLAAGYVGFNHGFGSGDLPGFALWSALAGTAAYPCLHLFRTRTLAWRSGIAYATALALGTAYALAWTSVVSLVLGPWIMAFSFPVFACWLVGAVCAFLLCVVGSRPTTWAVALLLSALAPTAVLASLRAAAPEPPPDLLVVLAPDATPDQIEAAWHLFQVAPTATPEGYNPEGIRTVSRSDTADQLRLRVTFHPSSDPKARRAVIARALASPLVAELLEVEDRHGVTTERTLKGAPPNNEMQRTRPAQATEPRR